MADFFARPGADPIPVAEARVFTDSASAPDDLIRAAPKGDPTLADPIRGWEPRVEPDGAGGVAIRYPVRGDACAVIELDDGTYWAVGWTPYAA